MYRDQRSLEAWMAVMGEMTGLGPELMQSDKNGAYLDPGSSHVRTTLLRERIRREAETAEEKDNG